MKQVLIPLLIIALIGIWLTWKSQVITSPTTTPLVQSLSIGEVTITATLVDNQIEIALDTHSIDLSSFDFKKQIRPTPTEVKIITDSQHHRRANLKYTKISLPFTLTFLNLANIAESKLVFDRR